MQPKASKTNYHFYISMVKSVIRIVACLYLLHGDYFEGGVILLVAEIIGIVEEL